MRIMKSYEKFSGDMNVAIAESNVSVKETVGLIFEYEMLSNYVDKREKRVIVWRNQMDPK